MSMEARFDRLDSKVDKIADAMTKLIEHDTKIDGLVNHNNTQDRRINRLSETSDRHAIQLATVTESNGTNEWFIRILIAACVSGMFLMQG